MSDTLEIADLIADAFLPLSGTEWLVPDPARRRAVLRDQFAILVDHALAHGELDRLADGTAVAVWFDLTRPLPPIDDYAERLAAACGPDTARFRVLDELFAAHEPERPHHHLALLAVRPDVQRNGRGSALLDRQHRVLDRAGVPAYLEASSEGSRDLYARHGYATMGEPFRLPNGAPFWPMWREPAVAAV
jgi:GNAT superfamily N-acetyltransferase